MAGADFQEAASAEAIVEALAVSVEVDLVVAVQVAAGNPQIIFS